MKRYSMYSFDGKEVKNWLKEDGITLGEYDIDADKGAVYIDVDINTVPDEYKYVDEFDQEAFLGKHIIGKMCTNKYSLRRHPEKYAGRPLAWVFSRMATKTFLMKSMRGFTLLLRSNARISRYIFHFRIFYKKSFEK